LTRRVGVGYQPGENRLPIIRLRWRRGDNSPELYVRTPRVRFRFALHHGQTELAVVCWRKRATGESGAVDARCGWITETFHEYSFDGAEEDAGEWIED